MHICVIVVFYGNATALVRIARLYQTRILCMRACAGGWIRNTTLWQRFWTALSPLEKWIVYNPIRTYQLQLTMAVYQIQSPDQFSFDPRDWKSWITRFDHLCVASKAGDDGAELVNLLIYHMGPPAEDIFRSFGLSEDDQKIFATVKKFEDHFNPKVNIVYERTQFNRRFQQSGETCESFITDLFKLVDTCDYGEMKGQIIAGMSDLKLSDSKWNKILQSRKLSSESELQSKSSIKHKRCGLAVPAWRQQPQSTQSGRNLPGIILIGDWHPETKRPDISEI